MTGIDTERAINTLEGFVHATDQIGYNDTLDSGVVRLGTHRQVQDRKVVQNQVGRRNVSETNLFKKPLSLDLPVPGKPCLRHMQSDIGDTYKSMQRETMALTEGIYAEIRNSFNHGDPADIDEQLVLEYLAAMNVPARWVDESSLERHS